MARFETEVDPDGVLPVAERMRRADNRRTAYFMRLALRSAQARRRSKAQSEAEIVDEGERHRDDREPVG